MPDDDVEKFLANQKTLEAQRHDLIKEVLRQKEAAIKAFDEKLAKLGYGKATDHASRDGLFERRRGRGRRLRALRRVDARGLR